MEISCLSTSLSLCQEYFQEDHRRLHSLTHSDVYPRNCDVLPLRIIDINDDCLEEIFMNLNLRQLFEVATVHRRFLIACRRAVSKKYRNKEIVISVHQTAHPDYTKVLYLLSDLITRVRITYDRFDIHGIGNFNRGIHDAIVSHCSDTLTEATFNHILPTMEINKPFRNLNKLNFNQGCVGQTMSEFNKWFPKLSSLQFFFCKTINTQCIEQTFPNLEMLTVAHHNFSFENLRRFLDHNQQLKSFAVYSYDCNLIRQLEQYTRFKFQSLQTKFEIYPCYFSFYQWLMRDEHLNINNKINFKWIKQIMLY